MFILGTLPCTDSAGVRAKTWRSKGARKSSIRVPKLTAQILSFLTLIKTPALPATLVSKTDLLVRVQDLLAKPRAQEPSKNRAWSLSMRSQAVGPSIPKNSSTYINILNMNSTIKNAIGDRLTGIEPERN